MMHLRHDAFLVRDTMLPRRAAPPMIGWPLVVAMTPVLLLYWLALAPVMLGAALFRRPERSARKG